MDQVAVGAAFVIVAKSCCVWAASMVTEVGLMVKGDMGGKIQI